VARANALKCSRALALGFSAFALAFGPVAAQVTFATRRRFVTGLNARSVWAARRQGLVGNKSPQALFAPLHLFRIAAV
jgi:hypothetical protein